MRHTATRPLGLLNLLLAGVVGLLRPAPARAVFASPIHAGCYVVAPGQCRFHIEPFTIDLASGQKLVTFRVIAVPQPAGTQTSIWEFRPDQSSPVPFAGSTYSPTAVAKDFSATCGRTYVLSLVGQDTGDANVFTLGATGAIECPSGAGGLVWIPLVTTSAADGLAPTRATLHGTVDPQGGTTTVHFEYGPTTTYGSAATPAQSTFSGVGPSDVSVAVSGLTPNAGYHVRLVASNSAGTATGADQSFTTLDTAKRYVTGKRLAVRGHAVPAKRRGTVILTATGLNAGLDPRQGGVTLRLVGTAPTSTDIWPLPASGWRPTKKGAKYADKAHANGPVTTASLTGKTLVVRAAGAGIGLTLPALGAQETVGVSATFPSADTVLCAAFQATNKKGVLVDTNAPPPANCVAP